MKRYSMRLILMTLLLLLVCASSALAVFNSFTALCPSDSYLTFQMKQGWWNDKMVWYILTETSDIRFSQTHLAPGTPYSGGLTLSYQLISAVDVPGVARGMGIIINNPAQPQGVVLDAAPAPTAPGPYSGIWAVYYVKWRVGATKVILKKWSDIESRVGVDLDISNVYGGETVDFDALTYVDAPIVAIGNLGGPWWPAPAGDVDNYRIKQGRVASNYAYTKKITLPTWYIFCADMVTNKVKVVQVIIPDVFDVVDNANPALPGTLADKLGANWAAMLANWPDSDSQAFWEFYPGPVPPLTPPYTPPYLYEKPPFQFPVIEEFPTAFNWRNINEGYSPIMRHIVLTRNPVDPTNTYDPFYAAMIDNDTLINILLGMPVAPNLTEEDTYHRFNAPAVPPVLNKPQPTPTSTRR